MKLVKSRLWSVLVLVIGLALVLSACTAVAPAAPAAQESGPAAPAALKVGLIHPSPITDAWSGVAYAALERMQKELGAEIANVEVADPAGYEKAFSDFASQGYNLVIGHGFQYQDAAAKVSPDFPATFFTTVGGNKSTANFAPIDLVPGYKQALYATGVMAGQLSKTKKAAGFTLELPATKVPLEGFQAGFESIPGNEFSMIILKDGNDVGAGKEAALQAMASGADILMWDGACIVHEEFKARGIADLKKVYPDAAVLVHPESPPAVLELADRVGSTTQIIRAAVEMANRRFIVATDQGIFYKLQQQAPVKEFIIAPTAGDGATCRSCANCPWMAMNDLEALAAVFDRGGNEIVVDPQVGARAMVPLRRMLDFAAAQHLALKGNA